MVLAKSKGKWFTAWAGPALVRPPAFPGDGCVPTMQSLIALGANKSLGMQLVNNDAPPTPSPPHPPAPAAPAPAPRSSPARPWTTAYMQRHHLRRAHLDRNLQPRHRGATRAHGRPDRHRRPGSIADCCSRCKALTSCEVFELGRGGCAPASRNCTESTINCFLIGGHQNKTGREPGRVSGCVRGNLAAEVGADATNRAGVDDRFDGGGGCVVPKSMIAMYLLVRGDSATIVLPPYDRPMTAWPFSFAGVDPDADPGDPAPLCSAERHDLHSRLHPRRRLARLQHV